jgi:hypothetical protein
LCTLALASSGVSPDPAVAEKRGKRVPGGARLVARTSRNEGDAYGGAVNSELALMSLGDTAVPSLSSASRPAKSCLVVALVFSFAVALSVTMDLRSLGIARSGGPLIPGGAKMMSGGGVRPLLIQGRQTGEVTRCCSSLQVEGGHHLGMDKIRRDLGSKK